MRCACIAFVDGVETICNSIVTDVLERNGACDLRYRGTFRSWRRSTRSLLEARFSNHTFMAESSHGARESPRRLPNLRYVRCAHGASSTTGQPRCWLMCRST